MRILTLPPYLGLLTLLSACGGLELTEDNTHIGNDGEENSAPFISGTAPTDISTRSLYFFEPNVYDPDGDALSFFVTNKPEWLAFDTRSGTLIGTPHQDNIQTYSDIKITVSDGQSQSSLAPFAITVHDADSGNSTPTLDGTPSADAFEGQVYAFTPQTTDLNGDGGSVTFSIVNQPSWLFFDNTSGSIFGAPKAEDVGVYPDIQISVTDGQATTSLAAFSITVHAAATPPGNAPPTISGTPSTEVYEGQAYSFTPSTSDAEEDQLTFSIRNQPNWLSFNSTTGTLFGVPESDNVGAYNNIEITVTDEVSTTSLTPFAITVHAAPTENSPPVTVGTPLTETREGQHYDFFPFTSDPDDDELTFSIANQPHWANFDPETGSLSGVPGIQDVGLYSSIEIKVTDGEAEVLVANFDLTVLATSASLSWVAPTTRADGSPLPISELAGYRLYSGLEAGNLELLAELPPDTMEFIATDLSSGTHYYALSVYNTAGEESELSEVVSKVIQ